MLLLISSLHVHVMYMYIYMYIWVKCSFLAPCLIRALERDDASVRFCKFMPSPISHCAVWMFLGFPTTLGDWLECRWRWWFTYVLFYVLLWCFVCVLILYVFLHTCCSVYGSRVYSGHLCTDVCVWMYLMQDKNSLQWLRDITAIYWATRDGAPRDFCKASPHKRADLLLMHY